MTTAAHTRSGSPAQGWLSTHVLDTMHGRPAAGMVLRLYRLQADGSALELKSLTLNDDGRSGAPLLEGESLQVGRYRLVFELGDYFRRQPGVSLPEPPFLDQVPLDFGIADAAAHYHVPLLASPWSYSTYRGS
ncbi:hydroxyisourate hydrolase [Paucibacter sp. AS339]|uniref:hydroxyisourate hydrolase n=1 Tax=Paucibacter hankyongi TaxID=3133434 RepID=UPI0030ABB6C2